MTTVQPSRTMMFVVTCVRFLLGKVKPPLTFTSPSESSGWTSMRIRPSLEMNGRSRSWVPMSRNSTLCVEAGLRDGLVDVALLLADLDFRPLLVQHHQPRIGDHVGVADRLQGSRKAPRLLSRKPNFRPPFSGNVASLSDAGRRAQAELDVRVLAEQLEVDAELVLVLQLAR